MNAPEIRAASLPSMGGIASAQALAKFYAMLASDGTWDGRAFFNKETMAWMSTRLTQGFDPVLQRELSLSAGFMMDPIGEDGKKILSLLGPSPSPSATPARAAVWDLLTQSSASASVT